ncbi:MAG: aminotransferase class V-fold PLP-dependent enzyme [Gaiellales bacterium]
MFGRPLRDEWLLDPDLAYLNHGTVGATPRRVLAHQRELADEIERNPARFMLRELDDPAGHDTTGPRLRQAAAEVASFVGVDADGLCFVDNITTGANAVLRSFPLASGDEIAVTSLGYGAVTYAAQYAARRAGAQVRTIELPGPGAPAEHFVDAIARGLGERTRLLVCDHITSHTALVLPLAEIAAVARARGAAVLADGAHVPGNVALDIPSLGVDWYAANLHKWALTPRSSGFLWVSEPWREITAPVVTSWGYGNGLVAEFDHPGTRDPTPFLSAPFALNLLADLGGGSPEAVYRHNHELACWAGEYLGELVGVPFTTPTEMFGAMVTVALPASLGATADDAEQVRLALERERIEAPIVVLPGGLAVRVSAQVYVGREDVERLGTALASLIR